MERLIENHRDRESDLLSTGGAITSAITSGDPGSDITSAAAAYRASTSTVKTRGDAG